MVSTSESLLIEKRYDEPVLMSIDKAFRHGDIENILTELLKSTGSAAAGGGLLEFAQTILSAGSGGSKFNKGDVKKVYFVSATACTTYLSGC